MLPNLLDRRSICAVSAEESQDELLEVLGEVGWVRFCEVKFVLSWQNEVVEVLIGPCLFERENSLHDDEEDDAKRKQINLRSTVLFAFFDLRGHVGEGAAIALETVNVLVARKPEIRYFQVELFIDEDVLKLQVSMTHFIVVHVLDGVEHLVSEEATDVFTHSSHHLAHVEQETALNELHHEVDKVL